jgi:hypothetical protein
MAINKATLAKEIDGVIEYIYPKTSADIVVYDETHSVAAMIDKLVNGKQDAEEGKGLSSNDFTDELKNKLDNIEAGSTNIDNELSSTSENAVQNKIITQKFSTYDRILGIPADLANIYNATSVTEALINLKNRIERFNLDVNSQGQIVSNIN